jgi:hypothetical protein
MMQSQQAQFGQSGQAPGSPGGISNADLLKYLTANGINPADLEGILRQRAYQHQLQQNGSVTQSQQSDVAELEDRLSRRFGDLHLEGNGRGQSPGAQANFQAQVAEEQRWLRQQQQAHLQQEGEFLDAWEHRMRD